MAAAALIRRRSRLAAARRLQLIALVAAIAAWEAVAASGLLYRGVVPSCTVIAAALFELLATPAFWSNLLVSLVEIVSAVAIGSVAGVAVGVAIGSSRLLSAATEPIVNAFVSTPKLVFLPVFYLLFGIGVGSKIAIGALGCFLVVAIGVIVGMLQINPTLIRVGRSFGLSPAQMATKIYLRPWSSPASMACALERGRRSRSAWWPKPASPSPGWAIW